MEGLIIAAVLALFGLAANKKKEPADFDGDPASMKKRLGDYAKGFFDETAKDFQEKDLPPKAEEFIRKSRETVERQRPQRMERVQNTRQSEQRRPVIEEISEDRDDLTKQDLFPLESEDVMKGIILAEIFSPPKSRK